MNKSKLRVSVTAFLLALVMIFSFMPVSRTSAQGEVTIVTTLVDGMEQRGSRKTFDVWARDEAGNKVSSSVTLNGEPISATWDDTEKTSYTLNFSVEGENLVIVTAGSSSVSYTIIYIKAEPGDVIGQATWSIEAHTIGCGYVVEPVRVDVIEGETSAQALIRLIDENGYTCSYSGSPTSGFYLQQIQGFQSSDNIPDFLRVHLENNGFAVYDEGEIDELGEFYYTSGSGWMYAVNNVFPNVGFADSYLSDGDVVRVQFTLAYGQDIGGMAAMGGGWGSDFYEVPDKDNLLSLIAEIKSFNDLTMTSEITAVFDDAMSLAMELNPEIATQEAVDNAHFELNASINHTVIFEDGFGGVLSNSQVRHGLPAFAPQVPEREGHTFSGWDKDFSRVISDMTVKAVWDSDMHTIIFEDGFGNVLDEIQVSHGGTVVPPSVPDINGYVFVGWDKPLDNIVEDITIYALWTAPLTGIEIDASAYISIGESYQLTVAYVPEFTDDDRTIVWTSDNESVATVSDTGLVTAAGNGTAIITAACGDVSAQCRVTVGPALNTDEIRLTDDTSRITIIAPAGTIPGNTTLSVNIVSNESELYKSIKTLLSSDYEKFEAYDIKLLCDGEEVIPYGTIQVRLPVPKGYDETRTDVITIENASYRVMESDTADGYAVIGTNSLGMYSVALKADSANPPKAGGSSILILAGAFVLIGSLLAISAKRRVSSAK